MGRVVFSVILLVLLIVLIVLNVGPTTNVNLGVASFQNVQVVAVALLSFVLGVVYSLVLYVGQYFHRASRQRLAKRHQDVEERERKLTTSAGGAEGTQEPAPSGKPADEPRPAGAEAPKRRQSAISKFFRKLM
jgi:uncharacterized integral membrane protein